MQITITEVIDDVPAIVIEETPGETPEVFDPKALARALWTVEVETADLTNEESIALLIAARLFDNIGDVLPRGYSYGSKPEVVVNQFPKPQKPPTEEEYVEDPHPEVESIPAINPRDIPF